MGIRNLGGHLGTCFDRERNYGAWFGGHQQSATCRAPDDHRIEAPVPRVRDPEPCLADAELRDDLLVETDTVQDHRTERTHVEGDGSPYVTDPQLGLDTCHLASIS